jgi:hypothetical protein
MIYLRLISHGKYKTNKYFILYDKLLLKFNFTKSIQPLNKTYIETEKVKKRRKKCVTYLLVDFLFLN